MENVWEADHEGMERKCRFPAKCVIVLDSNHERTARKAKRIGDSDLAIAWGLEIFREMREFWRVKSRAPGAKTIGDRKGIRAKTSVGSGWAGLAGLGWLKGGLSILLW